MFTFALMQVIEKFIEGKRQDQRLCEDGWVLTPDFAAVVDGSTSKVSGRAGGREAMKLVCEALTQLPAEADKVQMLRYLTEVLAARNLPESAIHAEYRLTCSAVIFSRYRRVVWLVGDCHCRWAGTTHDNYKLVDEILTRIRCEVAHKLLSQGYPPEQFLEYDPARAVILDELREMTNFQNDPNPYNPFRYVVLDGTPVESALVPEIPVPENVNELILASDGYPCLLDTWQETEEHLQQLLREDPLCIEQNPATKCYLSGNHSFDDRCYLRFRIES